MKPDKPESADRIANRIVITTTACAVSKILVGAIIKNKGQEAKFRRGFRFRTSDDNVIDVMCFSDDLESLKITDGEPIV